MIVQIMKMRKQRWLWRVNWVHANRYQAPAMIAEAKTRTEATELAKKSSRLADFPQNWRFILIELWKEDEYSSFLCSLDDK